MGQYQTRTVKSLEDLEEPGGLTKVGESLNVAQQQEPAPPIFGSPIDNESYIASLGSSLSGGGTTKNSGIEPNITARAEELLKEDEVRKIPIVFRWEGGGSEVYVCGTFNDWETKIPLTNSHGDFTAIVELPEGTHEYKFFVDGQWLHEPSEEVTDNGLGSYNNVVNVTKKNFDAYYETWEITRPQRLTSSPPGSYSQIMPSRSVTSSLPPHLPPLLQQTILNQEPPSEDDPTLLSNPNHVILNHLYALSIKDNVLVLAATHRYKQKYVTTLMYKPV